MSAFWVGAFLGPLVWTIAGLLVLGAIEATLLIRAWANRRNQ